MSAVTVIPSSLDYNISTVNGTLVMRNPNPVPLVVNITFYLANKPGIANVTTKTVIISAGGKVEYLFLGKKVTRHIGGEAVMQHDNTSSYTCLLFSSMLMCH